jgi:hypothetical protein
MMTVDGTDFKIQQPIPFSKRWYSHKFNGPGLRYEVAVSINGGDIVWTNGPFPCSWHDITIFRSDLMLKLRRGEMVEADKGYRGQPDKIRTCDDYQNKKERDQKRLARACHETVNGRFKKFNILKVPFRHNLSRHQNVFQAVVVLTQLTFENGDGLFAIADFD